MATEIERKYLVNKEVWHQSSKGESRYYRQGYLLTDPNKTIRVRISDKDAYITIKGPSVGAARPEYEYAIPGKDAEELLDQFCSSVVSKIRYKVMYEGKLWEVDEFLEDNEGLIIAEIELSDESEVFSLPEWIDKEVTGEEKYYNSNLSVHPYQEWK
jgi:CYTH domain-containing protein